MALCKIHDFVYVTHARTRFVKAGEDTWAAFQEVVQTTDKKLTDWKFLEALLPSSQ